MDLLKKVEEKWKEVTLEEALLLLVCVVLVVIIVGYCATLLLRKRNAKTQEGAPEVVVDVVSGRSGLGREEPRGSLRWSERSKVCAAMVGEGGQGEGSGSGSGRRARSPMLEMWQRRILMGEKCKLPRFSGVILYDERGRPLQQQQHLHQHQQVRPAAVVTTTMKELL
ncbi:hypothetical protein AAC387_Pa06g1086 [Persea americana]